MIHCALGLSFFTFSGRPPMVTSQFELTSRELREEHLAPSLVALYRLVIFDVSKNGCQYFCSFTKILMSSETPDVG